jgi:hypothetical protein
VILRLLIQTVVLALQQIWANKIRAMLTTLGIIIGREACRVGEAEALACVAGYTVCNDVSVRDW